MSITICGILIRLRFAIMIIMIIISSITTIIIIITIAIHIEYCVY